VLSGRSRRNRYPLWVLMCLKKLHITGTTGSNSSFMQCCGLSGLGRPWANTCKICTVPARTKEKSHSKGVPYPGDTEVDSITKDFCDLLQVRIVARTLKSIRLNHFQDYHRRRRLGNISNTPQTFRPSRHDFRSSAGTYEIRGFGD
jgi:hypothetical protein